MRLAVALGTTLLSAACTTLAVPDYQLTAAWSEDSVGWFNNTGENTIEGSALLRTRGGDVRTCAGFPADLQPLSEYGRQRIEFLYGSDEKGYNPFSGARNVNFIPEEPRYLEVKQTAICDPQGAFAFRNLPDGEYVITTEVTWEAPGAYVLQGGYLMQRVKVSGGETVNVVLTAN